MQIHLDGGRGEGGEEGGVGEDHRVRDDVHARVRFVQPRRHLPVRYNVNVADPRSVDLQ